MEKKFSHLNMSQRLQLKEMLDSGAKKADIMSALGVSRGTLYNEIRRGTVDGKYDPEYSEECYRKTLLEKGSPAIFALYPEMADYVSSLILGGNKSLAQIVNLLQNDDRFKVEIKSAGTIYKAIDRGLIPGVSRDDLRANTAVVFSGGQIRIPKWARELADVHDGDVFGIEIADGNILLVKVPSEE